MKILLLLILSFNVYSLTLNEVNKAIKENGATWSATDEFITNKSFNTIMNTSGLVKEDIPFEFEEDLSFVKNIETIPRKLDWRNYNGFDYTTPVKSQGGCGSCVAFATLGAFESLLSIAGKTPRLNIDLSEQHLFSCGSGRCELGWFPTAAGYKMVKQGVVDEGCFPYLARGGQDISCNEICRESDRKIYKASAYRVVGVWYSFSGRLDVIKALQKGPVVGTMHIYEDFKRYRSGIFRHVTGKKTGGHAVTIVGYNLDQNYWIAKNSWGQSWGEAGYFRIAMNDASKLGGGSVQLFVSSDKNHLRISNLSDGDIIKGDFNFEIDYSMSNIKEMRFKLFNTNGLVASRIIRQRDYKKYLYNTGRYPDGKYKVKLEVYYEDNYRTRALSSKVYNVYFNNGNGNGKRSSLKLNLTKNEAKGHILNFKTNFKFPENLLLTLNVRNLEDGTVEEVDFKLLKKNRNLILSKNKFAKGKYLVSIKSKIESIDIIGNNIHFLVD